jgi:transposase-like protein
VAIYDWVHKAELQPFLTVTANQLAVDEKMIRLHGQEFWLYRAVDLNMNEFLHVRVFPTRTIVLTKQFLQELTEKHDVAESLFLVDGDGNL